MGGVSTPPIYRGSFGGTIGGNFPPKLPLHRVGGGLEGSVGASLIDPTTGACDVELVRDIFWEEDARVILSTPVHS